MRTTPATRNVLDGLGLDANRITGGLYQGAAPPNGRAVRAAGFSLLVLCAKEHQDLDGRLYRGVRVLRCPLDDGDHPPTSDEWPRVVTASRAVAAEIDRGGRALVTCMAGRNRSGLLSALVLRVRSARAGRLWCGACCVARVRLARTRAPALTNPHFVQTILGLPGGCA